MENEYIAIADALHEMRVRIERLPPRMFNLADFDAFAAKSRRLAALAEAEADILRLVGYAEGAEEAAKYAAFWRAAARASLRSRPSTSRLCKRRKHVVARPEPRLRMLREAQEEA